MTNHPTPPSYPTDDTEAAAILARAQEWQRRIAQTVRVVGGKLDRSAEPPPWDLIGAAVWFVPDLARLVDDPDLRDRAATWLDRVDQGDDDGRQLLATTEQLVSDLRRAAAVRNMRDLVHGRNRLIGVMRELRGIECDLESAGLPDHSYKDDLNDALIPVVDMLTVVQRYAIGE